MELNCLNLSTVYFWSMSYLQLKSRDAHEMLGTIFFCVLSVFHGYAARELFILIDERERLGILGRFRRGRNALILLLYNIDSFYLDVSCSWNAVRRSRRWFFLRCAHSLWLRLRRTSSPRGFANLSITRRTNLAGARPFRCFPPCALPWVFYYLLARLAACLLPRLRSPEQYAPDKATCIYIKTQFGLIIGARCTPEYNHEPDEKITQGISGNSETKMLRRKFPKVNIWTNWTQFDLILYHHFLIITMGVHF